MKKIYVFLLSFVLVMAFTACNRTKNTKAPVVEPVKTEVVEKKVEEPAPEPPPAPVLKPAEMLKEFQAYAKAYGEAFNNMAKDLKKYQELAKESRKRVADMEKIKDQLNAKQKQDYQKSLDIVLKVNRGGK